MSVARANTNTTSKFIEPIHICIAFVEEYKNHRETEHSKPYRFIALFAKALGVELNALSDARRIECNDVINKLKAADTYAEKSKLIDTFSALAKKAQEPKEVYKNYPQMLINLFAKDNSLWAKTLHAIRTCYVVYLQTEYKSQFEAEIKALKKQYDDYKGSIKKQLRAKLTVNKKDEEDKDRVFNRLLDREDYWALEKAREENKFPSFLPIDEVIKLPEKVKVYNEFRTVYNPNYYTVFYVNTIKADPNREVNYNKFLKSQLPKYLVEGHELNILNEGFFESVITGEEFIEQTITPEQTTPETEREPEALNLIENSPEILEKETNSSKGETENGPELSSPTFTTVNGISIFNEQNQSDTEKEEKEEREEQEVELTKTKRPH